MISYTNILGTILPRMTIKSCPMNPIYAKLAYGCCLELAVLGAAG